MGEIVGQELALEYLKKELEGDQVSHAYLFFGPKNIGKTEIAERFSLGLICESNAFGGCEECKTCKLVASGNHPDFNVYDSTENMSVQEVREIIKDLELKSHQSQNRIFIISNVERLSLSAFNSFLKSLEEPNPGNIIILTCSNLDSVLDTIKSRTRLVKFTTADKKKIYEHLNKNLLIKREVAEKIVALSGGRAGLAVELSKDIEKLDKYIGLSQQMWQTYKNNSIYDKISFTDSLVKDDDLIEILEFSQLLGQNNLYTFVSGSKENEYILAVDFISSLENALNLLNKNISKKIVIDNLMLGNLNG